MKSKRKEFDGNETNGIYKWQRRNVCTWLNDRWPNRAKGLIITLLRVTTVRLNWARD